MSAVVMMPESRIAQTTTGSPGIPFSRLLRAEWRKLLDTRAGRWLLIVIAIITAVVVALVAVFGGEEGRSFFNLLGACEQPMSLLLPVVAILAATQERSQRTGLVTFVQEPRRTRVGAAKLLASIGIGLALVVVGAAVAALTHLALVLFGTTDANWSGDGRALWLALLALVVNMLLGAAFGALLLNTPLAIVALYLLPNLFGALGFIKSMTDVLPWISINAALAPLMGTGSVTGTDWAHLAVSAVIWVVLPAVGGLIRLNSSEIKSA